MRYSTAQLFARLENSGVETIYFEALPGIAAEFAFDAATIRTIKAASGTSVTESGVTYVSGIAAGVNSWIDVTSSDGKLLRLVVLTTLGAENAWKIRIGGDDHLLLTADDFVTDPDSKPARTLLRTIGMPHFAFGITPPSPPPSQTEAPHSLPKFRSGMRSCNRARSSLMPKRLR